MNIEQKLAVDKFVVDEGAPHIVPHEEYMDAALKETLTRVCPAGLYTLADDGKLVFEYAGCLECGTCRIVCAQKPQALEWKYPRPSFGVQYRFG